MTDRNGILTNIINDLGYSDLGNNQYKIDIENEYKYTEHYINIMKMELSQL